MSRGIVRRTTDDRNTPTRVSNVGLLRNELVVKSKPRQFRPQQQKNAKEIWAQFLPKSRPSAPCNRCRLSQRQAGPLLLFPLHLFFHPNRSIRLHLIHIAPS